MRGVEQRRGDRDHREALADRERDDRLTQARPGSGRARRQRRKRRACGALARRLVAARAPRRAAAAAASSGCSSGGWRTTGDALAQRRGEREVDRVADASAASAPRRRAPRRGRPRGRRRSRGPRRRGTPSRGRTSSPARRRARENVARVARELAVDAVGGEGDLQQHRARDEPPALAGRERRRREHARSPARPS